MALAILADFAKDVYAAGTYGYQYRKLFGWLPKNYKKDALAMATLRLLRVGNIERKIKDGEPYLRLTSLGWDKLFEDIPVLKFQNQPWDRAWRILVFDIKEINRHFRDVFRDKLFELGFGRLQKSVYLSPFPVEKEVQEFVESLGASELIKIFVTKEGNLNRARELARKVWRLDELEREYRDFLAKVTKAGEKEIGNLRQEYAGLVFKDPFLPKELLSPNWPLARIKESLTRIK